MGESTAVTKRDENEAMLLLDGKLMLAPANPLHDLGRPASTGNPIANVLMGFPAVRRSLVAIEAGGDLRLGGGKPSPRGIWYRCAE